MNRLKKPEIKSEGKISTPQEVNITDYKHPIFCFKYLHRDHHLDACQPDEKISLIDRLVLLSSKDWQELQLSPKHGLGCEKIMRSSIKTSIPVAITDDVTFFLAFRFHKKAPIVGFRNKFVFHIIYIDRDFTLYNH